jgi:hypothetical protein
MDILPVFCDIDDFCQFFEPLWKQQLLSTQLIVHGQGINSLVFNNATDKPYYVCSPAQILLSSEAWERYDTRIWAC